MLCAREEAGPKRGDSLIKPFVLRVTKNSNSTTMTHGNSNAQGEAVTGGKSRSAASVEILGVLGARGLTMVSGRRAPAYSTW